MNSEERRGAEAPDQPDGAGGDSPAERGAESYGGDTDAGPATTEQDIREVSQREPAEG
jgi:hypothetical protein